MPARRSAGILLFRLAPGGPQVLLVHPGGPFWARKDEGAWSIPKGEYEPEEDPRAAALREFEEEIGRPLSGEQRQRLIDLGTVRQPGGKLVTAWAAQGDLDPEAVSSNTFELQWPPRSGQLKQFPEIDRAAWFTIDEARVKLSRGQVPLLDALLAALSQAPNR
ncbi:MAG TPA: NUDIX domain-containing protein [Actinocrinis sp.]|nr:NUDIX domain-containing protein [Actinocrinis sp.]